MFDAFKTAFPTTLLPPPCSYNCTPFARSYWPPNDQVKAWLEPHWDEWVAAPPQWFTSGFVKWISTKAPPEVLPLAILQDLAEKHSGKAVGQEDSSTRQLSFITSTRQPSTKRFATTSRKELILMEEKRRANKVFARAKQFGIWAAALTFSYIDLATTVVVAREYLSMGTAEGTFAAHVTFGMLGASLGIQTLATYLTGTQTALLPQSTIKSHCLQKSGHTCSTCTVQHLHVTPHSLHSPAQAKGSLQHWPH